MKRKVRDNQGEVIGSKNWVVTAFDTTKTQRQKETETLSEKTLTTPPFNQKADGVTLPSNNVSVSAGKDNIKYHFGKKNKLKINKKDENKIGVALYVVNKEAKRCRDLSRWMYENRAPYPVAIEILQQLGDIGEEIKIDEYGLPFLEDEYSKRFYSEEGLRETIMELQNEIDEAETKLEEEEDLSDIEKEELQATIDFNQDYIDKYSKYEDDLGNVSDVFYLIKEMNFRKIDLYNLKEQIIENLDDSYIIGRHKFPNGDVRYLYKIGGFTFHGEDIQNELSDEEYDKIEEIDEISAENKLEDEKRISIGEAEKILNDFIAKNITESESKREGMLGVVLDALRKAIGKDNVITDSEEAQRIIDEQNGIVRPERVAEVNKRFNEELQQQIDGTLPKDHTYQLGNPSEILLSAGIPNLPIELLASRLSDKSMQSEHPFELSEIKDIVNAIHNPLVVFRSATHIGSNVILTELKHGKKSFVVAIETNRKQGKININSIRSIHYRTSLNIIGWLNNGLADYIKPTFNTEWLEPIKKELLSQPQYNSTDVRKQLNSVAKVLQNFENPTIIEQKNEKNLKEHRLVGGNSGYVGYSMSKRAEQAREEGRYPKTDFKKVYNISDKTLKALVSAGIIDDNEWHHTSKYGNKTTFYGWSEEKFATIYRLFKKEIDAIVKENQPQPNPYKYTEWNEFSEEFQALPYNVKKDKGSKELQDFLKTHPEDKAKYEENERYNQWQAQAPSPIETTRIVSEKLNKFFDEKDVKFFKTKEGEAYGFTVGGKVYIDTKIADASTPIHEYTHLWAEALRKVNPKEWQNIVSLMKKQTYLWDKVKNDYPELKTDDEIADEVLAHYSGERGKKLLDEEYDKIRGNNKLNIFDKAKMLQAINNVREALRKFWKGVADLFNIHFTSAEEVADKVLSDLLEGVNPNEVKTEEEEIIEKAKADGTYMKAPNGKKSNLNEKQWVQVRTKAFKKWFGDWELAARVINIVKGVKEHGFKSFNEATELWGLRRKVKF